MLKPSELTPFSALALAVLAERVGFPPGVINIVTGQPGPIGEALTSSDIVRKLSFTGSTRVGRYLMEKSAGDVEASEPRAWRQRAVHRVRRRRHRQGDEGRHGEQVPQRRTDVRVCANRILVQDDDLRRVRGAPDEEGVRASWSATDSTRR